MAVVLFLSLCILNEGKDVSNVRVCQSAQTRDAYLEPIAQTGTKLQASSTGLGYDGSGRTQGMVFWNENLLDGTLPGYERLK